MLIIEVGILIARRGLWNYPLCDQLGQESSALRANGPIIWSDLDRTIKRLQGILITLQVNEDGTKICPTHGRGRFQLNKTLTGGKRLDEALQVV